jgi:hypothetical protein
LSDSTYSSYSKEDVDFSRKVDVKHSSGGDSSKASSSGAGAKASSSRGASSKASSSGAGAGAKASLSDKIDEASESLLDMRNLSDSTEEKTMEDVSLDVYSLYGYAPSTEKTELIFKLHDLEMQKVQLHREASKMFGRKGNEGKRRRYGD